MAGMDAAAIKEAINGYYDGNQSTWSVINGGLSEQPGVVTTKDLYDWLDGIDPQKLEQMKSISGKNLGYGYAQSVAGDANNNPFYETFDSNIIPGKFSDANSVNTRINASTFKDDVTGEVSVQAGAFTKDATTGVISTVKTVADRISLGVVGVNLGAKLGRFIDQSIYAIDPEFWDTHLPGMNPETWDSIATSAGGKNFIRSLFGINGDNATAYISDDVLAYMYQFYRDNGFLDDSPVVDPQQITIGTLEPEWITGTMADMCPKIFGLPSPVSVESSICYLGHNGDAVILWIPQNPLPDELVVRSEISSGIYETDTSMGPLLGYTKYYNQTLHEWEVTFRVYTQGVRNISSNSDTDGQYITVGDLQDKVVNPITNSTQYPPTNITGTTPSQVKQQLKQNYPDLFDNSIKETVVQPDGSIEEITYVPMPWVVETTDPAKETTPQTDPSPVTNPNVTPQDQSDPKISDQSLPKIIQNPSSPTPPTQTNDTGTGISPVIPATEGSASSLWRVYNPSQSQIDAFGSWLWSSDFVDQIKKLFVDPMQAIIGVHKVFVSPPTSGSATIKCGYLDSNVSAALVSNQYKTINCGTISLTEYFGNVYDYEPYTSVKCFLPFIGIVPLDVSFIMRSKINIKYKVDVITGACLAEIKVSRDGCNSVIYTYSGSAIVTYPLSSGSYAGVISSVAQTALGIAMGSPTTVLAGVLSAHADTSVNGSFSGCAGAMGCKIPYLIISRPQTRMADNVDMFSGLGANYTTTIEYCKGFFKVIDVHLHIEGAYDSEITEITSLLKQGVLTESEYEGIYYEPSTSDIEGIIINQNGFYNATGDLRGYNPITVQVNPVLGEKVIDTNGEYLASDDNLQGFSKVTVEVQTGGIEMLTKSQWDALTTQEKRSYGLIAIRDTTTGFLQGRLVYGADYDEYLPNSNTANVKCEAYWDNFNPSSLTWGNGSNPVTLSALVSQYQSENAVYLDARSGKLFSVDLSTTTSDFVVYVVAKGIAYNSGDVTVLGSIYQWNSQNIVNLYHRSGTMWRTSIYGSDTDFIQTNGDYVAVAIRSNNMYASWFGYGVTPRLNVQYSHHGQYFTFGGYPNVYSTDLAVKFIAYVNQAEDDTTIQQNLINLASKFNL